MPLSHDEVVHGKGSILSKMPGDPWQKYANLRLLYGYQWTLPGKKLLFMGSEIGVWNEWNHDTQLDWACGQHPAHAGIARWVGDLNGAYRSTRRCTSRDCDPVGFQWLVGDDRDGSILAFLRTGGDGDPPIVVVANFTPVPREGYRVGVPKAGLLARDSQLRCDDLWRQRRRKPRRHAHRSDRHGTATISPSSSPCRPLAS